MKNHIIILTILLLKPFFLVKASPAELRKYEQAQARLNIKITHSLPLKIPGKFTNVNYVNRPHTVLNEIQLYELDRQLRSKNFANEFKSDGCYAKSHLISYELSRLGIQHSKVLIYGKEIGDIAILEDPKVYLFEFHISPLILVRLNSGEVKPYVLDLSFFSSPISLDSWTNKVFKNSKRENLTKKIVSPESIDQNWVTGSTNIYSDDLLYRFETEIDAFNFIIKNKNK